MASGLPRAEVLVLNPHPAVMRTGKMSIEVLSAFAECCPRLTELGLFINGLLVCGNPSGPKFGPQLRNIGFGRSPLPTALQSDSRVNLARHIAFIFPRSTKLSAMRSHSRWDIKDYNWSACATHLVEGQTPNSKTLSSRLAEVDSIARGLRDEYERLQAKIGKLRARVVSLKAHLVSHEANLVSRPLA